MVTRWLKWHRFFWKDLYVLQWKRIFFTHALAILHLLWKRIFMYFNEKGYLSLFIFHHNHHKAIVVLIVPLHNASSCTWKKSHDEPAIKITWFLSGTRRPHLLTGGFLFANKSDVEFHVSELKEEFSAWTLKYHINLDAFRVAFCNVYEIYSHNFLPTILGVVRTWRQLRKRIGIRTGRCYIYVFGIN